MNYNPFQYRAIPASLRNQLIFFKHRVQEEHVIERALQWWFLTVFVAYVSQALFEWNGIFVIR